MSSACSWAAGLTPRTTGGRPWLALSRLMSRRARYRRESSSSLDSPARGVGVGVGRGVEVGLGVAVGRGVEVGLGVVVRRGGGVGMGVAVRRGVGVGASEGERPFAAVGFSSRPVVYRTSCWKPATCCRAPSESSGVMAIPATAPRTNRARRTRYLTSVFASAQGIADPLLKLGHRAGGGIGQQGEDEHRAK